mmetsp:Transcript_57640/g.168809  ORF Transcript_57640/g.168809 Transcript_57640/m.168809 type:complete len:183 (+) Transcript_57640:12-560(+)
MLKAEMEPHRAPRVILNDAGQPAPCFAGDPGRDRSMLLIACELADFDLEMLVDTGAQMSVISAPLMHQLNLSGRLDQTQQGMASGVGHAMVVGWLRNIPVRLGHLQLGLDFSVLGGEEALLLLGIDQMRKLECVVDLDQQCLTFGGEFHGANVPFLSGLSPYLGNAHGSVRPVGIRDACAVS